MITLLVSLAAATPTVDLLRLRDAVPCTSLGATTPELRAELLGLAQGEEMPPWVPMRAADCLVTLYAADPTLRETLLPWMADPERAGLALLVLDRIDLLPTATAVPLATAAAGVADALWATRFRDRILRSAQPEVRAVVDGVVR